MDEEEEIPVDMSRKDQVVWLIKVERGHGAFLPVQVPDAVAEAWETADDNAEVGEMKIYKRYQLSSHPKLTSDQRYWSTATQD